MSPYSASPPETTSQVRSLNDPVLEERVAQLEASNDFPPDLDSRDWALVAATTLVIPLVLLIIAWVM